MTAIADLQKVYIGYFGRAADPSGLNYWLGRYNAGMSLVDIASSFAVQDESKAMYQYLALPTLGIGVDDFLNSVYLNLFNRSLDNEGKLYWSGQLAAGKPIGRVIIDIISGAQGDDAVIVANKVAVASYYTSEVIRRGDVWGDDFRDDLADSKAVLSGITKDAATVVSGKSTADTLITLDMNRAPTASAVQLTAAEDGAALSGNLKTAGAAADVDGNALTFSLVSGVAGFSLLANGDWSFNPADAAYQSLKAGEVVSVAATYRVSDGIAAAQSTVTFTVTGTNDVPVAQALAIGGVEDTVVMGQVSASDVDGDGLSYALVSATGGAVSMNPVTGAFTFTPTANFNGAATFTYTVSDGKGGTSAPQTVTLNLAGVNDAPTAVAVQQAAAEDGVALTGNLKTAGAAADVDGDALTFSLVSGAAGFSLASNGDWTFSPASAAYQALKAGETINVVATYQVSDGKVAVQSTVTFTVTGTNDVPVAQALTVGGVEDAVVTGQVSASDVDGDALSYALVSVAGGAVSLNASTGAFAFTPTANFNGAASFVYTVSDGKGGVSAERTVTLNLAAVNDAPTAAAVLQAAVEDGAALSGNLKTAGAAADVDGDALTFSLVSGAAGFSLASNGDWTFNPASAAYQALKVGEVVSVTATYRVSDGALAAQNTVTFTVTGTNDGPVAQALTVGGSENTVITGQV